MREDSAVIDRNGPGGAILLVCFSDLHDVAGEGARAEYLSYRGDVGVLEEPFGRHDGGLVVPVHASVLGEVATGIVGDLVVGLEGRVGGPDALQRLKAGGLAGLVLADEARYLADLDWVGI